MTSKAKSHVNKLILGARITQYAMTAVAGILVIMSIVPFYHYANQRTGDILQSGVGWIVKAFSGSEATQLIFGLPYVGVVNSLLWVVGGFMWLVLNFFETLPVVYFFSRSLMLVTLQDYARSQKQRLEVNDSDDAFVRSLKNSINSIPTRKIITMNCIGAVCAAVDLLYFNWGYYQVLKPNGMGIDFNALLDSLMAFSLAQLAVIGRLTLSDFIESMLSKIKQHGNG